MIAPIITPKLRSLPDLIKQDVGIALSAQALTWPIVAYNFRQISLIGIAVNILGLWTVPIIIALGAGLMMVSLISLSLAGLLAILPSILLTYFIDVIRIGDSISFLNIRIG